MLTRRLLLLSLPLGALGIVLGLASCSRAPDPWDNQPVPRVLVTVPALYSFAKSITGDQGSVQCLCVETGPHHYDYSTNDLRLLRGSSCFFTIGLGLDDKFSNDMLTTTPGVKRFVLSSQFPADLKLEAAHEPHGDGDKHHHELENATDPHVWLGTPQALQMVESIRDELKKVDPAHEADYERHAAKYIDELKKLHADGVALLKDKKERRLLSFHDSLRFFAQDYKLDIVDVIEDIPANEPDTTKILDLVQECIKQNVRVIAVEPQYPKSTAATVLLRELKAKGKNDVVLVEIDPLETASANTLSADLYVKTMRLNLENLAKSLP